jgi:C-terminal peptidase prc
MVALRKNALLPSLLTCLLSFVAGCGGGGSSASGCGESARKQWVLDVARDWYLFPDLLPAAVDLSDYATAEDLLDAVTATAREQGKDRYFSYLTTRAAENSLLGEGEFVGFGVRTRTDDVTHPFLLDVYAASPAADAGLQRGDEITAVDGVPVAQSLADGTTTVSDLLGPADAGVSRTLGIRRGTSTFNVTMTKRTVTIDPVPDGWGAKVLPLAGTTGVAYLHLRSYITTADAQLRTAFAQFRTQGINDFIIDLRYNGGGLVDTAALIGDLLGANRSSTDVQFRLVHNTARSSQDSTTRFEPQPQSVSPVRIAFLTTGATASASEINVNAMRPYADVVIVGENTLGKPVGQLAFDLDANRCPDRLRLISFKVVNSLSEGDYYNGLAPLMTLCETPDTLDAPLGSANDGLTEEALHWISTGACSASAAATGGALKPSHERTESVPRPRAPTPAEHWLPGVQ